MSIEVPQLHGSQVPGDITERELSLSRRFLVPSVIALGGMLVATMLFGTLFSDKLPFSSGGHF